MERFTTNLRMLWGAERLLAQHEIQNRATKLQINALAGLVAIFGLGMISIALFFAFEPHWGRPLAALAVAVIDLGVAGILLGISRAVKPSPEVAMVKEVREMAINGLKDDAAMAGEEIESIRSDIHAFVRNPFEALLPAIVNPMLGAVTKGLIGSKKSK